MESKMIEAPAGQTVPDEIIGLSDRKPHPLFKFMGLGSLIYAFFYTLFLYRNASGITYPFFVGGTCLFFLLFLQKSGITAKRDTVFITAALILLGISTCLTDSWVLIFLNKLGIFLLFFYLALHSFYEDKGWSLAKYTGAVIKTVSSCLCFISSPFSDFIAFDRLRRQNQGKEERKTKYVLIGVLIALPLLLLILLLLAGADAVFADFVSRFFSWDTWRFHFFYRIKGHVLLFLFAFFASYCLMCRLSQPNLQETVQDKRKAEPVVGITVTALVSLLYLFFCGIQVIYLFARAGDLPQGYTYSSYAREGFFQLVFVCLLNLALVLICCGRFRENKVLKTLLTLICGCTYIMIASSVYRMLLYISVYHLTFLRLFVLWALLVISLLMAGAVAVVYRKDFPFTAYCVGVITVLYLLFSFARPDGLIASYNIENCLTQENATAFYDFASLEQLSLDAAPAILSNRDILTKMEYYSYWIKADYIPLIEKTAQNSSPGKWNYSRWKAAKCLKAYEGNG